MRTAQTFDIPERLRWSVQRLPLLLIAAAVLCAGPALAIEAQQGDTLDVKGAKSDMLFLSGKDLRIAVSSTHDVFAAGQAVRVDQASADHLFAISRTLSVVGADVRNGLVAGRDLSFESGQAQDGVVAFGQTLNFRPAFKIGGSAVIAGQTIDLRSPVGGDLYASGDQVTLDSAVGGNVQLQARHIVIGPDARIVGDLAYRADQIEISPQAVIGGHKTVLPAQAPASGAWKPSPPTLAGRIAGVLFGAAGFLILALGLTAIVPGLMARAGGMVGRNPLMSAVYGLVVLVMGPAVALVLLITLLGAPLAVVVLLIWGLLLIAAGVAAAAGLGLWIRARARREAAAKPPAFAGVLGWTVVGGLALCGLGAIPFIGGWVWLIACLLGAGALAAQGREALATLR